MKLSHYAKKVGISYRTAWNWYRAGRIQGYQAESGTIIITEENSLQIPQNVAIYARVSSSENKSNLESQADRLFQYCAAKGYQVTKIVKEVGSGLNDTRPKLLALLQDTSITVIVIEHRDRLTRFGFQYIKTLLELQQRHLDVVNLAENAKEDLLEDLVSIITSFCARIYGQRRSKRKTEKLIRELQDDTKNDTQPE